MKANTRLPIIRLPYNNFRIIIVFEGFSNKITKIVVFDHHTPLGAKNLRGFKSEPIKA